MSAEPFPSRPVLTLAHEAPGDAPAVEALLDRAFGPGRFVKVSERVREFAHFAPELSFLAWSDGVLAGVVRQWRVRVGETPVVFLGPLAVDPGRWSAGVGQALVARACEAAQAAGESAVLLVGDPPYFARFGFQGELAARIRMPGPVDRRRLLVRALRPAGERLEGAVGQTLPGSGGIT
jgi:predicted N-acetyltransferase YhbS